MLNIFGALGQVARLLPNYLEGQRLAVQDNWRDLNQYNQVEAGQLQNMFDERVMPFRINMMGDLANVSRWNSMTHTGNSMVNLLGLGGRMINAYASNSGDPLMDQQMRDFWGRSMGQVSNPLSNSGFDSSSVSNWFNSMFNQQGNGFQMPPQPNATATQNDVRGQINTPSPTSAALPPQ